MADHRRVARPTRLCFRPEARSSSARASPARRIRLASRAGAPVHCRTSRHGLARARREASRSSSRCLPVLVVALVLLAADPTFHIRRELARGFGWVTLLSILAVFAVGGGAATHWIMHQSPELVPRVSNQPPRDLQADHDPLSAVLRRGAGACSTERFYFHRFGPLFGDQRWLGCDLERPPVRLRPHRHGVRRSRFWRQPPAGFCSPCAMP